MKNHILYGILLSKGISINCFACFQWILLAIVAIYRICPNEQVGHTHTEREKWNKMSDIRSLLHHLFCKLFHLLARDAIFSSLFKSIFYISSTVNTTITIWCHRNYLHCCIWSAFIFTYLQYIFFFFSFIRLELLPFILVMVYLSKVMWHACGFLAVHSHGVAKHFSHFIFLFLFVYLYHQHHNRNRKINCTNHLIINPRTEEGKEKKKVSVNILLHSGF